MYTCKIVPFMYFYTLLHLTETSSQLLECHDHLTDETSNTISQPLTDQLSNLDNQPPVDHSSILSDYQLDSNKHPPDDNLEAKQSEAASMYMFLFSIHINAVVIIMCIV